MTVICTLWLPILLAAVFVFIASFALNMALPWHRKDYRKLADEDQVMAALRPFNLPAGDYMVPNCNGPKDMKTPEFQAKIAKGPIMVVTVMPTGEMQMGKSLAQWFIYLLVVGLLSAYVACHALPVSLVPQRIWRIVGVTSFLGYAAALMQMSIWYRRSWLTTFKFAIDGLIYAVITAATFVWLWPR